MKVLKGIVISTQMEKTVVVSVETWWQDPVYQKRIKRSEKYKADDQIGVKEGDWVEIKETRPLSKEKRWTVIKVLGSKQE